ncbi:MAG: hypothetical protein ONB46_12840 [candidate division KSB1 bacterium]|nr:hypothetical protein [candidate division KSB1 bacterium]MDZ7366603.1 hypothetical protein [candidate division KSB1 bacterium]MDZ7406679.1 hypothetical protein [candidate division KSB1 bacterium]
MRTKTIKAAKTSVKPKAGRNGKAKNGKADKSLPISKIRELYKDEWLAVHLTKVDRYNNPIAGVVVAHAKSDDEVIQQAEEYSLRNPKAKIYTFVAGSYFPEGVSVVLSIC